MDIVIGLFAGLYVLWQLLTGLAEGAVYGVVIGTAGAVLWYLIRDD